MNRRSSPAFGGPPMFRLGKGEATLVKVADLRRLVMAARRGRALLRRDPSLDNREAEGHLDRALDPFLSIE